MRRITRPRGFARPVLGYLIRVQICRTGVADIPVLSPTKRARRSLAMII